jgi:hypothetical protein
MSAKDKDFTPIMVSFDEVSYNKLEKKAKEKLELLDQASVWIHNNIPVKKVKLKNLHNNILEYFKNLVVSAYKDQNTLGLSAEKLIEFKEIPYKELAGITIDYLKNDFEVQFDNGIPSVKVERRPFEVWTTNNNQNKLLLAGNKFIKAVEDFNKIQDVAQLTISQATRGFVMFDMAKNKYFVNPEIIRANA